VQENVPEVLQAISRLLGPDAQSGTPG
jgi:hypothetical protein